MLTGPLTQVPTVKDPLPERVRKLTGPLPAEVRTVTGPPPLPLSPLAQVPTATDPPPPRAPMLTRAPSARRARPIPIPPPPPRRSVDSVREELRSRVIFGLRPEVDRTRQRC